jgi:hypothetical protein
MKKRTPRIAGAIVGTAVASLALASVGSASIQVKPANYDPGKLGTTVSKWANGAGVPDGRGLEHGLKLSKGGVITDNAAGQAMVTDVRGRTLSNLGFTYKGYCGAGAPRFDVELTSGARFWVGCNYGTATASYPGWTHVSFNDASFLPASGSEWPGLGNAEIQSIGIIQDEVGAVVLDNVRINGHSVQGPKEEPKRHERRRSHH